MPSPASVVMTSRTSWTISGSRAEVGSSKSITLGFMASARAMAARCCWPPESWAGYLSFWLAIPTRSSSAMPAFSASAREVLRTLIGPSVTFSRIVLCANRLKLWNTIPTSARSPARALPSSGSRSPSTSMSPLSIGSSRLIARHSVDLPDPDGPSTTTTWPDATSRLMSRRTWRSPKCLSTDAIRIIGAVVIGDLRSWRDARGHRTPQSSTSSHPEGCAPITLPMRLVPGTGRRRADRQAGCGSARRTSGAERSTR